MKNAAGNIEVVIPQREDPVELGIGAFRAHRLTPQHTVTFDIVRGPSAKNVAASLREWLGHRDQARSSFVHQLQGRQYKKVIEVPPHFKAVVRVK